MNATDLLPLLKGEELCLECLAGRAGHRAEHVEQALDELSAALKITQRQGLCARCVGVRVTYRLTR